jgi:hypothetical protein
LRRAAALLLFAALGAGQALGDGGRYEGPTLSFRLPSGWTGAATADISAESAARATPPAQGKQPPVRSLVVLVGGKKISDGDLESESSAWHAAHVRNRSAWGMRSEGGTPRDLTRVSGRRAVRYRDQVGSALGANEQTLTCSVIGARLACVIATASPESRDAADALTAQVLSSLVLKRR